MAVPDCSSCVDGYYGDPAMQCLPCPCNNHSLTCTLNSNGIPICTNCEVGYTGNNCELCADGYYGNATVS